MVRYLRRMAVRLQRARNPLIQRNSRNVSEPPITIFAKVLFILATEVHMKRLAIPLLLIAMLSGCADAPSEWYGISKSQRSESSAR
jgi:hypothetical protein